ncbi:MAG: MBL fold metallo-hydrolase [Candidatus Bathyarchaeota archaeon]|nr:MBL fold metallo-hydrolase [Candidatus Bathyarchaeum sp.]
MIKEQVANKMVVKNVSITVLLEDTKNSAKPKLQAKHGLSFCINATVNDKNVKVLMDTGPSPDVLLNNVEQLNVNLEDADVVVLSHGHYDHTGGLIVALKQIKKRVPVIGHPTLFDPKFSMMPHLRSIGAPFRRSDVEFVGGVPLLVTGSVKIADGITTTGEVPRTTSFEAVRGFWTVPDKSLVDDIVIDDQSLIVNVEGKGLVVIAGCAHAGIINTINYAKKITGNSKVHAVLGGFHLISADDKKIQTTVDELEKLDLKFVGPCHCTGKKAVKKMCETFGDRCRVLCTGDIVEL